MIALLDINEFIKNLTPVTTADIFSRPNEFHPDGLFSERIFGITGSRDRSSTYSYIELNTFVIHPTAIDILLRLDRKIEKFISTEESFSLDSNGMLVVDENGVTGLTAFVDIFPKIKFRTGTESREKLVKVITESYDKGTLFIDKLPIIPSDFRDAYQDESGEWVIDKVNELYQGIIRRASQIKSSGTGTLGDLLKFSLQTNIRSYNTYIRSKIEKKEGLIRQQLLGKRVDYSARSVITPNPKLKIDEVGMPFRMAVALFEPFIIHKMMYTQLLDPKELEMELNNYLDMKLSIDSITKILKGIKNKDKIPERLYEMFYEATDAAVEGRVVLVKRDPVLHTASYMAYYIVLHRGDTLELCTMQVGPHNADFDGDTMAVFHPITDEAQQEAKERMMTGLNGTRSDEVNFEISKEMWLGLYVLTKPGNEKGSPVAVTKELLLNANNQFTPVKFKGHNTTLGRAILNSCFPSDYPFQDILGNKKNVKKVLKDLAIKYDSKTLKSVYNALSAQGFKWATISGASLTMDVLELPPEVYKIKEKLKTATPDEADLLMKQAQVIIERHLHGTGLGDLTEAGAGKGFSQVMQILVAKGITADASGNILDPIAGSYSEGLSNDEYFRMTPSARKGIIDRVINTADTGYLSRKLAFVLNPVEADPTLIDCKTKRTLTVKLTSDLKDRLTGRFIMQNGKVVKFDPNEHRVGSIIELRSPIFCKSKKLCFYCYGELLKRHRTPFVGVLAAQAIGERGTQMIMRTFHTGGAVDIVRRDMLQDIIDGDPLSGLDK